MSTKLNNEVLFLADHHRTFSVGELKSELKHKVSRQYLSTQVNKLVEEGKLIKMGSGRWTRYALPQHAKSLSERANKRLQNNKALDEYKIYADFRKKIKRLQDLPESVGRIISYGFTEMLNNAIDHSGSKAIQVGFTVQPDNINFIVEDHGIGIFRNIMRQRKLVNELEAIQDLTKGKVTTMTKGHTGEGVFFTSKVADLFIIESFGYTFRVDNLLDDLFVEKSDLHQRGTKINFKIAVNSKRDLGQIFRQYQVDPEGEFDVTEIKVKLYKQNTEYISRSQAKRLLVDLNKFKRIILDFENVKTVGQGFADEVFRVFQTEYPDIVIIPENMNEEVKFMVDRVEKPQTQLDF